MRVTFQLTDSDLKYFRGIMKEVRDKTRQTTEEEIVLAAKELLATMVEATLPDFVRERMSRLEQMIGMLEDSEWALSGRDRERVVRGLAYFAEPEDMIPDRIPVLGFLDDAIMVELVAIELAHELEAYEDFCGFRVACDERSGGSDDPATRAQWIEARRRQLHARMRRRRSRRRQRSGSSSHSPISLW